MAEGEELTFTISASDPTPDRDLTVNLQVTEDTSQSRSYLDASQRGSRRAVLNAGLDTATYMVKTVEDDNDEYDGTVTVTLRPGTGYTVGATDAASAAVTDGDRTAVTLIIGTKVIAENGGKTDLTYQIADGPLKAGQTIAFKAGSTTPAADWTLRLKPGADNRGVTLSTSGQVAGVTATSDTPIVTMSGAGVRYAYLELTAVDDGTKRARRIDWSHGVHRSGPFVGGGIFVQTLGSSERTFRLGGAYHIHLIDDENTDPVQIGFSQDAFRASENEGFSQPVVTFSKAAAPDFTLPLIFTAGTATEGEDYWEPGPVIAAVSTTLRSSFDINLIDDNHKEDAETFTVEIDMDALPDLTPGDDTGNGWTAGTHTTATITINDNDGDVHASVRALDTTATEGSSSDKARFRVSLDSVRSAVGPLTDGDSARIDLTYAGGALGRDFGVNLLTNHPTLSSDGASVKFNPNAVTPAQNTPRFADFELIARQDADTIDDVVTVTLGDVTVSGSGISTGTTTSTIREGGKAVITLRDDDREATGLRLRGGLTGPVADDDGVFMIGEGSSSTFFFGLEQRPTAVVTATASISSGGHSASITSGASHNLNPAGQNWRVTFTYNYNTQTGSLTGKQIVVAATEDIATVPTDDVTLRIALSSDDKFYDGAVYEYPIKVIDNEQPISVGLVSTSAVNLPESHHGRIKLAVRASRPVHRKLTPQLTWPDPSDTGHFTPEQDIDISVEPIPVGGTMGYIYLDAKDDNIAEAEASATATLSLDSPPPGVTVDQTRNTFLLRHSDDDRLYIRLIERRDWKGTTDLTDDTFTYAVYFTRPVDYSMELRLVGKDSGSHRILSPSSTTSSNNPNLTRPHEITILAPDQYNAIVARTLVDYTFFDRQAIVVSNGIQLIDHDDPIPVIGPPLDAQSSETSPQGEVQDAYRSAMDNGGDSLNDRVSAVSVSDVTPDGFTLGWSAANGADSYRVRYWQDENAVSVVPVAGTTYTVTGLDAETEYSAQIMAVVNGNVNTGKSSSVITVTTAAAGTQVPQACNLPADAITVAEVTDWRDEYSAATHQSRWNRVLEALGEDTGSGESAMTAAQARDIKSRIDNSRWDRTARTLEAMAQCDAPPPPPPTPEISIASAGDVTEGSAASFTITASPAPSADLSVNVSVSQSGDYGVSTGAQTVTIPTSGTYTLTVATSDDSADEADGSVTATVDTGAGYTVSSSASAATVAVSDNDDPPATCNLPSDAITVDEVTGWRDALDTTKASAGIARWNRVLATLGEDTGLAPMTAEQGRQVANWLKNNRWQRTASTLEAMEQCNN